MGKLWAVTKREYLERVRTKWFIIGTLVGPLVFAAMLIGPAYLSLRSRASRDVGRIAILDATGAGLGARVARAIAAPAADSAGGTAADTPATRVRVVTEAELARAESLATAEVVRKETRGYLVLTAATLAGDSARYAGRNASSLRDVERLRTVVRQEVLAYRLRAAGLDSARVAQLTGPRLSLSAESVTDKGRGGSGTATAIFAGGVAVLLYFTIFLYGQNVLRSVIEEKTTRVAEVVISSVKPSTLLAGKVLGVGAVGLTQQFFWILGTVYIGAQMAPVLARMAAESRGAATAAVPAGAVQQAAFAMPSVSPGMILALLLFFVFGYAFYSALFAAVGSTVNSETEAQQATAPILVLLIGSSIVIQPVMFDPSSQLARTMSVLPFSSPIIMPLRMGMGSVPAWEVALSLAVLAASCAAAIWVSARIYRTGLLMYGKRPTLGEMVRWVGRSG